MPAELGSDSLVPRIRIVASPIVELTFSLYIAVRALAGPIEPRQAWAQRLLREKPELLQRIAGFWNTPDFYEWAEIVVFAHRLGKLFAEPEDLFSRLEEVAAGPFLVPELPSESPGVREILQERLDRLAASPELRAAYIALLREFWAELQPDWERGAKKVAADMVKSMSERMEHTADVRSLLPRHHFAWRDVHAELVHSAVANGDVVLSPLALAGVGVAFFALPHFLLIAVGPDAERARDQRRASAAKAAARFKILSDPTRLSILTTMCQAPCSLGELAREFGLAQPTISVHVKMLREAELLESTKTGGQTFYRSSPEKVRDFIAAARADAGIL
ncbi:MAG: metalloregulator ArsR/SmtB family transcription factor [Anaerolineaceae bacterium]